MSRIVKRLVAAMLILLTALPGSLFAVAKTAPDISEDASGEGVYIEGSYAAYRNSYMNTPAALAPIEWNASEYSGSTDELSLCEDEKGNEDAAVLIGEDASVEYTVNVPETGLYSFKIEYCTITGKGYAIELSVLIDNEVPFSESELITLSRKWKDSGKPVKDKDGNEIRPEQIEELGWETAWCQDSSGYYNKPFLYYLEKGERLINLKTNREPLIVGKLLLCLYEETGSYEAVVNDLKSKGIVNSNVDAEKIQAENTLYKSDKSIYASNNKASASIEPQSAKNELLNVIDDSKFKLPGQWISWETDIKEAGFYNIAVRFQQSERDGAYCSRALLIDGESPFEEAAFLRFNYSGKWQVSLLGNNEANPYLFYFDKGKHTIELQVTMGDMSETIGEVDRILRTLNDCYRGIYVITGPNPDVLRDYNFDKLIPERIAEMKKLAERLKQLQNRLAESVGERGSFTSVFDNMIFDIEAMVNNPRRIAAKMSAFKSDLGAIGEWLMNAVNQPVSFDWLWAMSPQSKIPDSNSGFFTELSHQTKMFFYSFVLDYSSIGKLEGEEGESSKITVWMTTGRDQSRIVRRMVDQGFSPKNGVSVDLQLVASGTLMRSIIAGNSPDVAMQLGVTDPLNYALRGAVVDLKRFDDFDDIKKRFNKSGLNPFTYMDMVYALPETFSFPMLFYRTDVFEEIGFTVPETWEDVKSLIVQLSAYNMEFGLPFNVSTYAMMLTQNELPFYNEDRTRVNLDADDALKVFNNWINYYKSYGLPIAYDFANRFRTGEMPIGIADFITTYNQLSVFAPEIKGQWSFVRVPGTKRADGQIDRTSMANSTGISIMSSSGAPDKAWEYLKWWTSAEAQAEYGSELESVLGLAARYAPANREAVELTAWPTADYRNLMSQWDDAMSLPEVPGSYIVSRYIDFAARAVLNKSLNPGQTIIKYTGMINSELERKRTEFFKD